jgi:hypothetical protein
VLFEKKSFLCKWWIKERKKMSGLLVLEGICVVGGPLVALCTYSDLFCFMLCNDKNKPTFPG